MPLTIIEGFAAGIPCVSTDVGSCKELIYGNGEKAGEVTKIADTTAIANAYIKFFSNESLYYEYQKNAINRVETLYTKERFLNSYKEIYERYLWQE
jgi:glycosyltransferase involved in cell wall biosynthesis